MAEYQSASTRATGTLSAGRRRSWPVSSPRRRVRATGGTCTAWFDFCAAHGLHPYRGVRRTHLELYLRHLETLVPPPAAGTRYRRIATLSSWFRWLEDENVTVGNPAARIRRPQRHPGPQPWLNRNQLTDLLAADQDEGGDVYAPGMPART